MAEQNLEIVRRAYAAISTGDAEAVKEVLPEDFFADFSRRQVDPWALPRDEALVVAVEARVWNVWTFHEGKPLDVTYFGEDRAAAFEAAGLSE